MFTLDAKTIELKHHDVEILYLMLYLFEIGFSWCGGKICNIAGSQKGEMLQTRKTTVGYVVNTNMHDVLI